MPNLRDVTILITTFLRDGCLIECVNGIMKSLPECRIVVVDDGYRSQDKAVLAAKLHTYGHKYVYLPFDSGLPAKRNYGVKLTETPYMLMGCDDFDFTVPSARAGILKLLDALDTHQDITIASGRRANEPYEGYLSIVPGEYIKETRLQGPYDEDHYYKVDLTVNYFLARVADIRNLPWDERMKIGGEHGDWFLDLKGAGKVVVWVPGVNITEIPSNGKEHPEYAKYRARAVNLGHKIFLEKRGVKDYRGFDDNR